MNWKGLSLYFAIHFLFPAIAGVLLFVLLRDRKWIPQRWLPSTWALVVGYLVTRVFYAVFVYYVAGYDGYWDFNYYAERARKVVAGQTPGLDFESHFNPLFYYLQAGGLWLVGDPKAVGLLLAALLGDAASVILAARLADRLLGAGWGSWTAAWLIVCPLPWHALVVWGQDEGVFVGTLLGGIYAALRRRPVIAGLVLGFGFCATKVTYAPYAFAIVLAIEGGWRSRALVVAMAALVCAVVYGGAMALGGDPFGFVDYDTMDTLDWFYPAKLLHPLMPGWERRGTTIAYLVATLLTTALVARGSASLDPDRRMLFVVVACHCVSVMAMPYSNPNYMLQALPLMVLLGALATTQLPSQPLLAALAVTCALRAIRIEEWQEPERTLSIFLLHLCHAYALVLVVLMSRQPLPARPPSVRAAA